MNYATGLSSMDCRCTVRDLVHAHCSLLLQVLLLLVLYSAVIRVHVRGSNFTNAIRSSF